MRGGAGCMVAGFEDGYIAAVNLSFRSISLALPLQAPLSKQCELVIERFQADLTSHGR